MYDIDDNAPSAQTKDTLINVEQEDIYANDEDLDDGEYDKAEDFTRNNPIESNVKTSTLSNSTAIQDRLKMFNQSPPMVTQPNKTQVNLNTKSNTVQFSQNQSSKPAARKISGSNPIKFDQQNFRQNQIQWNEFNEEDIYANE